MALLLQSNVHGGLMRFLFKFQTWPMRLTLISELSIFVNLISYILLGLLVLKNARFRLFCTPIKRFQLSIYFDSRNVECEKLAHLRVVFLFNFIIMLDTMSI